MSEKDLKNSGCNILEDIDQDDRCDCCGMHISRLKPFGVRPSPLFGVFRSVFETVFVSALLLKRFRPTRPYCDEAEIFFNTWFKGCKSNEEYNELEESLKRKYGEKYIYRMQILAKANMVAQLSWECKNCYVVDNERYFQKLLKRGVTFNLEDFVAIPQHELYRT